MRAFLGVWLMVAVGTAVVVAPTATQAKAGKVKACKEACKKKFKTCMGKCKNAKKGSGCKDTCSMNLGGCQMNCEFK